MKRWQAKIQRRRNEKLGKEREKKERETSWSEKKERGEKKEKKIFFKEAMRERDIK